MKKNEIKLKNKKKVKFYKIKFFVSYDLKYEIIVLHYL